MTMPRPSDRAKAAFQKLVPADPAVTTRPMFGNLAAFVNGNMFSGLFGEDLFVRVSEADQDRIRKEGGKSFEPMAGRTMTGYVVVPAGWQRKPDGARAWIDAALTWSRNLPAKEKKAGPARPKGSRKPAGGRSR